MNNKLLLSCTLFLFLLKIIAVSFTNFNLFGDEAQYWLWSRNLDYGYFSKPPFLSWFIGIYTFVFGNGFITLKLLPPVVYFIISWSLYVLCKNLGLEKKEALSCSLLFLLMPAVSFSSFIISTDIFLLLFWTLCLNELVRIKKSPKIKRFVFLGVLLGLAFLSKYAAVYFLICLAIYVLFDVRFRGFVLKNYSGFFLSFFCLFLVLLPNIIWNLNNGWVTLQHTSDNANLNNLKINFFRGVEFLFIQCLLIGPVMIISAMINYKNIEFGEDQKFLLIFSLPIFLIVFFEAVIVRANANWAAPALVCFFLFLYIGARSNNNIFGKINLFFNFVFCVIFFFLIGISYQANFFNRIVGLNEFSKKIYLEGLKSNIQNYVISDRLLFSSMSYELRNKKLVFHMPYKKGSKITNHFKISSPLLEEMNKSFILIGSPEEIDYLENFYSIKKKETPEYKFTNRKISVYEIVFY